MWKKMVSIDLFVHQRTMEWFSKKIVNPPLPHSGNIEFECVLCKIIYMYILYVSTTSDIVTSDQPLELLFDMLNLARIAK